MLNSMLGAVEMGLLYAFMALGVYITFRILDFPDLTVDGSFTTGGAIAAVMITNGYAPWLATWPLLLVECWQECVRAYYIRKARLMDCYPVF